MKVEQIVGADLSKKTIDLVCHHSGNHVQINNDEKGYAVLYKWLKEQQVVFPHLLIVMEHTGLYSVCFEQYLHKKGIAFIKVSALEIKRSMGLVRGKSDKMDARRIAAFGYQKREQLQAQPLTEPGLQRLQMLSSTRRRLVKQRSISLCAIKEYRHIGIKDSDELIRLQLKVVECINKQIDKLNSQIDLILAQNTALQNNYHLLLSLKGVGREIALAVLIKTLNFTRFSDGRKFACYCGTAPFEHSSGSSIRGRTKVSPLADKTMKSLLDQGAKTAIQYDPELKAYYQRRILSGKSKMSTINVVRNKLIYRMFAVIKRQTPFVENFLKQA